MGKGKSDSLDTMEDLLLEELHDLYDVEESILHALPKMEKASSTPELKAAFQEHLEQTRRQKDRLDEVFRLIHAKPDSTKCAGIRGIIEEGEKMIKAKGSPSVKDAGLVGAAQRVEHYEMAAYGTARSIARRAGHDDVASLLQQTLDEEGETDQRLTDLAEGTINPAGAEESA